MVEEGLGGVVGFTTVPESPIEPRGAGRVEGLPLTFRIEPDLQGKSQRADQRPIPVIHFSPYDFRL